MYRLQVTVTELNIRNTPQADPGYSNWVGSLKKGATFYAETLLQGGIYDGNNNWYADTMNRYYWAGGVTVLDAPEAAPAAPSPAAAPPVYPQWMSELCLPQIWAHATGNNVGVAVVDTGIAPGIADLPYNTATSFTYAPGVPLADQDGHGTNCAGIIGARNKNGSYIGVAPDASLYVCKIADNSYFDNPADAMRYAAAINWCAAQEKIHIISISWGNPVADATVLQAIQDAVTNAVLKNKIVVCAMGDAFSFGDSTQLFPACTPGALGIGAIPVDGQLYPFVNEHMVAAATGYGITSYGINADSTQLFGTSQANAVVAGIIALMIQQSGFSYTPASIKQALLQTLQQTSFTADGKTLPLPVISGPLLLQHFTQSV